MLFVYEPALLTAFKGVILLKNDLSGNIADSQIEFLNVSPSENSVRQLINYQNKLYADHTISVEKAHAKKQLRLANWVQH